MLAQAVRQMQSDDVTISSSEYSSQEDFEYAIATKLSHYMKLGSICHSKKYVEEGCSPEVYPIYRLNGSVYTSDLGKWGDGASCATFLSGGLMCFDAYITLIDVNGYSKPNTVGKDVYFALIDFDNMVINPAKGYKTG